MRTHKNHTTTPAPALLEVRNTLDQSVFRLSALCTSLEHLLHHGDGLDHDTASGFGFLMLDEMERLKTIQSDLNAYAKGSVSAHLKLVNAN